MNFIQKQILNLAVKSGVINLQGQTPDFWSLTGVSDGFNTNIEKDDDIFVRDGYASNTHVYAIIKKIVDTAATIPFKVYVKTKDGLEEDLTSDLQELLDRPNQSQTQREWREESQTYGLLTGDFFLYGVKTIGFGNVIGELTNLPPNSTDVLLSNSLQIPVGYQTTINGTARKYTVEEVWHGKLFNPTKWGQNSFRGMSPLQAAYRTLIADNELITAEASFYKNKGVSGIISSGSDSMMMTSDDSDRLQAALTRKLGGSEKVNGVITTGAIVNYTPIGMSPSDLDMIKSGDVKLRNLCMAYGVDSKLFGDPKASTYNNVSEVQKQLYTDAVIPLNDRLISYLNRFVTPTYSKRDKKEYVIKQDLREVEALQKDKKTEAEKNKIIADTITGVLSAPISDQSKIATLLKVSGMEEEEVLNLIPQKSEGTGAADNTGGNVQVQSLNGAQVTSMVQIVAEVGAGNMPKPSAISILVVSFGLSQQEAAAIINPIQVNTQQNEQGNSEQG